MDISRGITTDDSNTSTTLPQGKTHLLAIGINDYLHCPKLENAVKDVEDFIQLMTKSYGFDPQNIQFLRDKEATHKKILTAFKSLVTTVKPEDSVIIYFSGHGEMDEILDEGYWIPVEAKPAHENQYIANSTIQKVLNKINSFHTFLIVDSCYSGSLFLEGKTRFVSDAYDFPSRWGLTSGRATVVSDGKKGENSPFASALLTILKNTETPLNAGALCDFIKQTVAASSDQKQLPVGDPLSIKGHQGGQFVFRPTSELLALPADIRAYQKADSVDTLLAFMRNFPDSPLRQAAVVKLETLLLGGNSMAAVATPQYVEVAPMPFEPEETALVEIAYNRQVELPVPPVVEEKPIAPTVETVAETVGKPLGNSIITPQPMVETPQIATEASPLQGSSAAAMPKKSTNPHDIELILVKGGTFQMGSFNGQDREQPVHAVTLSDFYIGKFPVTQKQWIAVMGTNPSYFKGGELRPVESVSFHDVKKFIEKLNVMTGKSYRLPTEAEWEFAARGGIESKNYRYAGSDDLNKVAWYDKNAQHKTHSVGKKLPNELGLYDMNGNVWEWCEDFYDVYTDKPKTNPIVLDKGIARLNRGGAWDFSANQNTTTYRCYDVPETRMNILGFRLAMSL
jgi:formylglycine-generating enzyme